jgi:hypothetical protein
MLIDEWQYSMSISQSQAIGELNTLLDESYSLSSIAEQAPAARLPDGPRSSG